MAVDENGKEIENENEPTPEEKLTAAETERDAAKQEAEDARLEVFTQDYTDFLELKKTGKEPVKKEELKPAPGDDKEFEHMTKKQVYDKAMTDAEARIDKKLNAYQDGEKAKSDATSKQEVAKFAAGHKDDFEQVRPIMYGLSLEAKHAKDTLAELYDAAKERVKTLAGVTDDQKAKSKRAGGEKPGKSSGKAQARDKTYTADEAANEAWDENVGPDGLSEA